MRLGAFVLSLLVSTSALGMGVPGIGPVGGPVGVTGAVGPPGPTGPTGATGPGLTACVSGAETPGPFYVGTGAGPCDGCATAGAGDLVLRGGNILSTASALIISECTVDGADTGSVGIYGGGAPGATRGGGVAVAGNESGSAGAVGISGGNTPGASIVCQTTNPTLTKIELIQEDGATDNIYTQDPAGFSFTGNSSDAYAIGAGLVESHFGAFTPAWLGWTGGPNSVTVKGEVGVQGMVASDTGFHVGASTELIDGCLKHSANLYIQPTTADGADNSFTQIAGGGVAVSCAGTGISRGGYLEAIGNEFASGLAGAVRMIAGAVATGDVLLNVTHASAKMLLTIEDGPTDNTLQADAAGLVWTGNSGDDFKVKSNIANTDTISVAPNITASAASFNGKFTTVDLTGDHEYKGQNADGTLALLGTIALGTDTTGNYANGDAEAGNALTGDSATAFFASGTLEDDIGGTGQSTYATGDTLYASAANTLSKLTGNITTTRKFYTQTGNGASSAAPAWNTIANTDLSGNTLLDGTVHTDTLAGSVARGDVIVGNSTPKWARVAIGAAGKALMSDGTDAAWSYPAGFAVATLKTSGTSITTGAHTTTLWLRLWGGGGGGGGADTNAANTTVSGGGGAGGYAEWWVTVTPATPYSYTIGALGAGGVAGQNNGTAGGNTTFVVGGTTVTAKGGSGGIAMANGSVGAVVAGGAGGTISTNGTVNAGGQPGERGYRSTITIAFSGTGGSAGPVGGAGQGLSATAAGNPAVGFAAGGGGAASLNNGGTQAGGNGAPGAIMLVQF